MQLARPVCLLIFFLFFSKADALEVRFHPPDQLYLHTANERYKTHDLIAHLAIVKNDSKEKITLETVRFQFYAGELMVQEVHLSPDKLVEATAELVGLKEQGMKIMADIICPQEALGESGKLASKAELLPDEALTARNLYITVQSVPTHLRVEATAKDATGQQLKASGEIKIVQHKSANKYIFPLEGEWYMQAVPNVTSHHRWMSQTEFGIDFLKVDDRGNVSKTDGKQAADFYAYGQPVLATADGVVVTAIHDAVQNWDMWLQRKGESEEEFYKRSEQYQIESMKKDLYRAVTGNLVVIEHANKEYSAYAHLKTGSLRVKEGDRVQQGQKIAEVGDTGDYYMPHLHFQISNHPDVLHARSLPFVFGNLRSGQELGHFARVKK